jgi:hypothetical protein
MNGNENPSFRERVGMKRSNTTVSSFLPIWSNLCDEKNVRRWWLWYLGCYFKNLQNNGNPRRVNGQTSTEQCEQYQPLSTWSSSVDTTKWPSWADPDLSSFILTRIWLNITISLFVCAKVVPKIVHSQFCPKTVRKMAGAILNAIESRKCETPFPR